MEIKEIKTLDDLVLAYKKGQLLRHRGDFALWGIDKFQIADDGKYTNAHIYCVSTDAHGWYRPKDIMKEFDIMVSINTYNNSNFMDKDYTNEEDFVSKNYIEENKKEDNMEDFVKDMIIEHKDLCERIDKLSNRVCDKDILKKVDPVEYANECLQLHGMSIYEKGLRARLHNCGIEIANDSYYATIKIEDEEEVADDND